MKRHQDRLRSDRKFQIFIFKLFLIGHINVNKGVFCLIISYLQIKSYNVLNYNNCSTDWPFPLIKMEYFTQNLHQHGYICLMPPSTICQVYCGN